MSVNDISQIDKFVEHAQFHNEQYGDNIVLFIAKHYGKLKADHDKEHQDKKGEHENLPFNHNNCSHTSSMIVFVLNSSRLDFKTFEFSEFKKHTFFYQAPSSSLHSEGLLQPPRHS